MRPAPCSSLVPQSLLCVLAQDTYISGTFVKMSYSEGAPTTTKVYAGNLNPEITESEITAEVSAGSGPSYWCSCCQEKSFVVLPTFLWVMA